MTVNIHFAEYDASGQVVANDELGPQNDDDMFVCFAAVTFSLSFKAPIPIHWNRLHRYVFYAREDLSFLSTLFLY